MELGTVARSSLSVSLTRGPRRRDAASSSFCRLNVRICSTRSLARRQADRICSTRRARFPPAGASAWIISVKPMSPIRALSSDKEAILNNISNINAGVVTSGTVISEGLKWGHRVLSPTTPYVEGSTDKKVRKIMGPPVRPRPRCADRTVHRTGGCPWPRTWRRTSAGCPGAERRP